jgi:hypothetical protein
VREWALAEYVEFLAAVGLPALHAGYTISDNVKRELKTIITIHDVSVDRARTRTGDNNARPLAIVAAYNEADIIEEVTRDMLAQGCDIAVIDNWSHDGTWDILQTVAAEYPKNMRIERFPSIGPSTYFDLQKILNRKQEIAAEYPGRWIINADADEIRRPPFPKHRLAHALAIAEQVGATRVNFSLLNFRPVDDRPYKPGSLREHFKYFEYGSSISDYQQKKAWRQGSKTVDLAFDGGHTARFGGARDFPYNFVLRHYPIRSQNHGRQKVLDDRQARWSPQERAMGWHNHYDVYSNTSKFIWSRTELSEMTDEFWQDHGLLLLTDIAQRRITELQLNYKLDLAQAQIDSWTSITSAVVEGLPSLGLFTSHGTVLHIDPVSGELRHSALEKSPANVTLVWDGPLGRIVYEELGHFLNITCLEDHSRKLQEPNETATLFEPVRLHREWFGLRARGLFLCAELDGRVTLSRRECQSWEAFLLMDRKFGSPQPLG